MSNIKLIRPVLSAKNLKQEVLFFEKLGFVPLYDSVQYYEKFDYAILEKNDVQLHLQSGKLESDFGRAATNTQTIRIIVDNLDEAEQELAKKGFPVSRQHNTRWNTNEFTLYSPSHNAVIFQQDLEPAAED